MRGRPGRRALVGGVALGTVLIAALLSTRAEPRAVPTGDEAGQARAAQACRSLQQVTDLIDRNAGVPEVLEVVDRAVRQARDASAAQARWFALAGGADSLAIALRADDPQAASVGIRVVTAECARTAAPLR